MLPIVAFVNRYNSLLKIIFNSKNEDKALSFY